MVEEEDEFAEMDDEEEIEIEMDAEGGGAEEVAAEEPKAATLPPEPEQDDESDPAGWPQSDVALSTLDCTPDVSFSACGIVSKLTQGAFPQLLSGVRGTNGAKGGRFLFEVTVLEEVPGAKQQLNVGFSTAGSSLFLGDGSVDGVGFGMDGTYFMAEPGQLTTMHRSGACKAFKAGAVIGIVLNLDAASSKANTVSIFLDGARAGPPQPVPHHLQGKGLFPTVTFRGFSLAVNLGQGGVQFKALPFKCRLLSQLDKTHAVAAVSHAVKAELVVPVCLPECGLFDFAERFRATRPEFLELSDGSFQDWCHKSGIKNTRKPGTTHSRDEPDFATGLDSIDDLSWQEALLRQAQCSNRSTLVVGLRSGLVKAEREKLLARFPASMKKIAVVAIGEPSSPFKQWVHSKVRDEYETKKTLADKQLLLAEASGIQVETPIQVPPAPILDASVWFLPRVGELKSVAEISAKVLASNFAKFTLPTEAEGFDEVRYEWSGEDASREHLGKWLQERKSEFVVEGLTPGIWFQAKFDEWKEERVKLRNGHKSYSEKKKAEEGSEEDVMIDLATVADIHNADGDGTPVYADFKFEDWLMLSWRYELHLLAHAFLEDAGEKDLAGIPEDHVSHYFKLYYGQSLDPKGKIGADGLEKAVKLLKEPLELKGVRPGHRILKSKLERTTPLDAFVKSVEAYRRDRQRRLDAGDESALLRFPRPTKPAPAKNAPTVAGKGGGKGGKLGKPAAKAGIVTNAATGGVPAKESIGKAAPALAKAAPRPIVKMGGNGNAAKRPPAPQAAADVGSDAKRPRLAEQQAAKVPVAKVPIAKRRPA